MLFSLVYSHLSHFQTFAVNPGSGKNLKMHTYLKSGNLTVWVSTHAGYGYQKKATWNTNGHHYVDLVSGTGNQTYYVRLWGTAAYFDGGIYSEP